MTTQPFDFQYGIQLTTDELMTYTHKDLFAYYTETLGGTQKYFKNKALLVEAINEYHGSFQAPEPYAEPEGTDEEIVDFLFAVNQKIRVDGALINKWPNPKGGYFKKTLIRDVHCEGTLLWTNIKFHKVELQQWTDGSWTILRVLTTPPTE